jgi:hypothetical protein
MVVAWLPRFASGFICYLSELALCPRQLPPARCFSSSTHLPAYTHPQHLFTAASTVASSLTRRLNHFVRILHRHDCSPCHLRSAFRHEPTLGQAKPWLSRLHSPLFITTSIPIFR